jgi:hypothetical protein
MTPLSYGLYHFFFSAHTIRIVPFFWRFYTNNGATLRHLAVLAVMTMSLARTDAYARMSNSGTASRS